MRVRRAAVGEVALAQSRRPRPTRVEHGYVAPHFGHHLYVRGSFAGSRRGKMVPRGLDPRTLRLLAVRSNQLSYDTVDAPRD